KQRGRSAEIQWTLSEGPGCVDERVQPVCHRHAIQPPGSGSTLRTERGDDRVRGLRHRPLPFWTSGYGGHEELQWPEPRCRHQRWAMGTQGSSSSDDTPAERGASTPAGMPSNVTGDGQPLRPDPTRAPPGAPLYASTEPPQLPYPPEPPVEPEKH